jgi:hypothetical protein
MVALPAKGDPVWWFAPGPPDRTPFKVVADWDIG